MALLGDSDDDSSHGVNEGMDMATTRRASTIWDGSLLEGSGRVTFESSGIGTHPVSWPARSAEPDGVTSPEELLAAAHATCFSMALSAGLSKAGTPPTRLTTSAEVDFQPGTGITGIRLTVSGDVPGVDETAFRTAAEAAKAGCPVSRALSAVPITLTIQ
jgi:lipoyl-dependent peroxiredoxin